MERLLKDIYDAIGSLRQRISYLETQDGIADQSDAISFVQLTDAPDDYIGQSGKVVAVTAGEDGLEFVAGGGGGVEEFTDLTDTPENYTGHGGKVVAVNVGETGLEFVAGGGALADHDHSGDAGDGGTFDAANLTSGAAADGYVLTADGSGGAAWEVVSGGASELDDLTDVDLTTPPSDGQALVFDSGSSTWKAETLAGGVTDFLDLTDTPASYTYSLAPLRVNNSGDGVEDVPGIRLNAFSSAAASILVESELSRFTAITKSNSLSSALTLYRYRGSAESALAVEDGDVLGDIGFYGSPNGTNVVNGAEIRATVDGTVTTSPNRVPAKLAFRVAPAGGLSAVERITLRSSGHVGIDQTEPEDKLHVSGAVALDDISTPSTPSADTHKVYTKSDGLYVLNSAGTEVGPLGSGGGAVDNIQGVPIAGVPSTNDILSYNVLGLEGSGSVINDGGGSGGNLSSTTAARRITVKTTPFILRELTIAGCAATDFKIQIIKNGIEVYSWTGNHESGATHVMTKSLNCYASDVFDIVLSRTGGGSLGYPATFGINATYHTQDVLYGSGSQAPILTLRIELATITPTIEWVSHEILVPLSDNNVSSPPTDAELDTAFGAPEDGFVGLLDDDGANTDLYLIARKNGSWWHVAMTKAT